ncbi:hypothetical protein ZIOFF_006735 [Zingiber officinale]|uniref:Hydrophobic protein OSR8 n=1 Tax=Zingiber officinale TaxID=94328 RepID=A0A8J5ID82_ZINOF|nr:hypothetical protein ZIOFF_006735 [Zingiber officinale]
MASERCCFFLEIVLSIILPPLGVFLHYGCCSVLIPILDLFRLLFFVAVVISSMLIRVLDLQMEFCICLLLTILGYLPGIIYAIYVLVAVDHEPYRRYYYQPLA